MGRRVPVSATGRAAGGAAPSSTELAMDEIPRSSALRSVLNLPASASQGEGRPGLIYKEARAQVSGLGDNTVERSGVDFNAMPIKVRMSTSSLLRASANTGDNVDLAEGASGSSAEACVTEETRLNVEKCAECLKNNPRNALCFPEIKFREQYLHDNEAKLIAGGLAQNTYVMNVDLTGNSITCAGVSALAKALPSTRIMGLYLGGNKIGDNGACAIAKAVAQSTTLTELNLSGRSENERTRADREGFSSLVLPALSSASPKPNRNPHFGTPTITRLGADALAEALASSGSLLSLCLSNSVIKE